MKARFLLAAAAFACAVFTAEAFDTYKDAFQAARKARSGKKFDESLKILEEAKSLAKTPGQKVQALDLAAEVCWNKKDLKGTLAKLDEILALEDATVNQKAVALTKKGNFLKWSGKRAKSEEFYKKAMELEATGGTKQSVLNNYADLLRLNKKYDEALKLYQKAVAMEKGVPYHVQNAKLGIARVTAEQKNYDKALELFNEVINIPKVSKWIAEDAYKNMVERVYFPQKKFEEAGKILDKLEADETISKDMKIWIVDTRIRIALDPVRGLIREKKFDEAAEKLKAADAFQTKTGWINESRYSLEASLMIERANALKREKKNDEAIEGYKKVLEMKDAPYYSKHSACLYIARTLISQKKFDEAKEYIDKAMAIPKQNPGMQAFSLATLANYYVAKQNLDETIATLEKILSLPGDVDVNWKASAYTRLADIYFNRKKDLAKAEEYIKKAMDLSKATWGRNKSLEKRIQKALENK